MQHCHSTAENDLKKLVEILILIFIEEKHPEILSVVALLDARIKTIVITPEERPVGRKMISCDGVASTMKQ